MKLIDRIRRQPVHIAFGQAMSSNNGLTSVDLAAVREADTVTMTASDGSAAPIGAADASNAGVMTAADRVKLDGLGGALQGVSVLSDVAAATVDAAITHIRTAGYAALGDGGAGLYKRVGAAPAHALYAQSADGAYWELVALSGTINVLQAGADPTGLTDCVQAFRDCADFARYNTGDEQSGGANGPAIIVPQGKYYWSDTFEPRAAITMIGFKRGIDGNLGTIIQVAADKTGIILPKSDTVGADKESPNDPATKGANGSFLQGFRLESLGGSDPMKHGIFVRVPAVSLSDVEIRTFPGNGFHIRASTGGSQPGDVYGNANVWHLAQCGAFGNQQSGFYIAGSDVNAGTAIACNAVSNGRWGIWDSSFLSNTHIGHHAQGNGHATAGDNQATGATSVVVHSGDQWHVVPGQDVAASTTEPGTDPSVWFQMTSSGSLSPTASFPAWQSGNTYVSGGAYNFEQGSKLALGCYAEDDNVSALEGSSQMIGGLASYVQSIGSGSASGSKISGGNVYAGGMSIWRNPGVTDAPQRLRLLSPEDPTKFLSMFFDGGPSLGVAVGWKSTNKTITMLTTGSAGSWACEYLTDLSTYNCGRSVNPGRGNILFPNGIFLGLSNNARRIQMDAAAPTSGDYAKGEIVLNRSPSVETDSDGVDWTILGWQCTTSGSPGTWQTLWQRVSSPPGL